MLLVFSSFGFSQPNDYPKLNVDVYGGVIGGDIERKPLVSHVSYPKFPLSFGGRTEIRLTEEVGIGVDFNYAFFQHHYSRNYHPVTSSSANMEYFREVHSYKEDVKKTRLMLKFNFYYGNREKVDFYFTIGAGAKWIDSRSVIRSVAPNYGKKYNYTDAEFSKGMAFRIGNGFRFKVSNHFAIMAEVGIGGGSLLQTGLSYRF